MFGIETDLTGTDVKGSADCFSLKCPATGLHLFGYPDLFGTITGRAGYAFDRFLIYAKGGAAWVHEYFRQTAIAGTFCAVPCTGTNLGWGWTVGAGFEYAFYNNWSLRLEYDYLGIGNVRTTLSNSVGDVIVFNETRWVQAVKLGLNYKFSWGKAPVVAKY